MLKVLIALICLVALNGADVEPESTLGCHRRIYYHNVTRKDTFGRGCWDVIPMLSCWGRCDSNEVSEYYRIILLAIFFFSKLEYE